MFSFQPSLRPLALAGLIGIWAHTPAQAQLWPPQLWFPGAQQPAPQQPPAAGGKPSAPAPEQPPSKPPSQPQSKPKASGPEPAREKTILGQELLRDGAAGAISFQSASGREHEIEISRLALSGNLISNPSDSCLVEVVADTPIQAKFVGRPHGSFRYNVDIEACPFSFDVLNDAILVAREPNSCDFTEADCRVDATGLWGPRGDRFTPAQTKSFERERGHAETLMRTQFRTLMANAGKDKALVKQIAGEQAGFSSMRDEICRDYAAESAHGFCALRITQARALALQAASPAHPPPHPKEVHRPPEKAAGEQEELAPPQP